jgi:hypothetical protein
VLDEEMKIGQHVNHSRMVQVEIERSAIAVGRDASVFCNGNAARDDCSACEGLLMKNMDGWRLSLLWYA